jgi:hypothetical protein
MNILAQFFPEDGGSVLSYHTLLCDNPELDELEVSFIINKQKYLFSARDMVAFLVKVIMYST